VFNSIIILISALIAIAVCAVCVALNAVLVLCALLLRIITAYPLTTLTLLGSAFMLRSLMQRQPFGW
jgi:hypothetical protein